MKFIYKFKIYDRNLFPTCSTEARKLLLLLKCRVSVNITSISLEHWKYTSSSSQTVNKLCKIERKYLFFLFHLVNFFLTPIILRFIFANDFLFTKRHFSALWLLLWYKSQVSCLGARPHPASSSSNMTSHKLSWWSN